MLLRNRPRLKYNGLTVILSNPSRFDKVSLLNATGGTLFNNKCLAPEFNQMQCDIRVMGDDSSFLPETKCFLVCGEPALHHYCSDAKLNTINEMRGSPLSINGIPAIPTFVPQDAADLKPYERQNSLSADYNLDNESDDEDSEEGDTKSLSRTAWRNYAFWLKRDVWKAKQIIQGFKYSKTEPVYKIYPAAKEAIDVLTNTKNQIMLFDIETDYEEQNLLCFSFSFDGVLIYCVPVLNPDYRLAYSLVPNILRALGVAFRDNTVVAHNGAAFDFPILAYKYKIACFRVFDTMLAQHRCFPDVEKSLGHCISYWTWECFHKDTDSHAYTTSQHMMQKLQYCGKDVYGMGLVYQEQKKYAKTIIGLESSIACAMDSINPYLVCSLQGIRYSEEKRKEKVEECDRQANQYLRMIHLLIGEEGMELVRKAVKGKAKTMPNSNSQCCEYFHKILGYKIMFTSPDTGKPSLRKKVMYKLALMYPDNPVITLILLFRILKKERSALTFIPWRDDENRITNPYTFQEEHQNPQKGNSSTIQPLPLLASNIG